MEKFEYAITDKGLDADQLRDALDSGNDVCAQSDFRCRIKRVEDASGASYVMTGPSGRHSIDCANSDVRRLWKHWVGFKLNNREYA